MEGGRRGLRCEGVVDGAMHARKPGPDARRDRRLRRAGFRVLRVSAQLVLSDLAAATALVRAAL
jgi:very-short-patch-repair endonuclease